MSKKISPKVKEYLISLLNNNEEIARRHEARIISSKLATPEDIDAMQNWVKRVKAFLQRAEVIKPSINTLNLSNLKDEAIALDSEYPKSFIVQYQLMSILDKKWTPVDAPAPIANPETKTPPPSQTVSPPPLFNPDGTHHNFLGSQKPSSSWTIMVDESGGFKPKEFERNKDAKPVGVCVAVLIPEETKLPEKYTHATEIGSSKTQDIIQIILESNCAVIGTSCKLISGAKSRDDLWIQCNKNLIDLILLFLPVDKKTTLKFYIEQRNAFNRKTRSFFDAICQDSLSRLRLIDNKRYSLINTEFNVISKEDHKWNGYPDAAAHIWAYDNGKETLEMSQWVDTCLFESDSKLNQDALNFLQKGAYFSYEDWSEILSLPQKERSLLPRVLELLGNCFKSDPKIWCDMHKEVQVQNLYSGRINMELLQRQVDFLSKYKPDRSQINDEQQLSWLQTQIAHNNHLGHTDFIQSCHLELTELCSRLYEENAPLVCNTMLNISTGFTNSFQFVRAKKIIGQWLDEQPGLPGSQFYSQVLSLMGQLETFLGNHNKAIEYFNQALERFTTLSDEKQRSTNIRKTSSYKVIAMMDSDPIPDNMLEAITKYLESPLVQAARFLSEPHKDQDPFQHHVLLRYLTVCRDEKAINAYLTNESRWTEGSFHPWELIYFYRALLVNSPKKRNELLRLAVNTALSAGDGTLNVIGCVILGGLYYYDSSCKDELANLTQKVIESMLYMDKQRVQTLQNQIESPQDPLTLAKAVLPFNFR